VCFTLIEELEQIDALSIVYIGMLGKGIKVGFLGSIEWMD
jgi:hypothetical protein